MHSYLEAVDHWPLFVRFLFIHQNTINVAYNGKTMALSEFIIPWDYKRFSCPTRLSMKFIMLINIKLPTIVGI